MNSTQHRPFRKLWWLWTLVAIALLIVVAALGSSTSKPEQQATSNGPALTGYGTLMSDWNAHHQADPGFGQNSAYNPRPALAWGGDLRYDDQYYALQWQAGRAAGYNMRFATGQSLEETKQAVMEEFPSDASIVWSKAETINPHDACYQMEVSSPAIAEALGTDGQVFVELYTDTPRTANYTFYFDSSNVNAALLEPGAYKTAADAPAC